MFKKVLFILFCMFPINGYAAFTGCVDKVTRIHVHKNGNIYFNTETACSTSWCIIDWSSQDQIDRAFSAMLASKIANTELKFYWAENILDNCNTSFSVANNSPEWFDVF